MLGDRYPPRVAREKAGRAGGTRSRPACTTTTLEKCFAARQVHNLCSTRSNPVKSVPHLVTPQHENTDDLFFGVRVVLEATAAWAVFDIWLHGRGEENAGLPRAPTFNSNPWTASDQGARCCRAAVATRLVFCLLFVPRPRKESDTRIWEATAVSNNARQSFVERDAGIDPRHTGDILFAKRKSIRSGLPNRPDAAAASQSPGQDLGVEEKTCFRDSADNRPLSRVQ